jgi:N-dimethylarginine dimethylaminohydrolase
MFKNILLCRPLYFAINYEINPWMKKGTEIDKNKLNKQYLNLKKIYQQLNLNVYEIDQVRGLADMVYAANYGSVINKTFIKTNFRYPQRQKEVIYAEKFFKKIGYTIVSLPNDCYFEGQGDLLMSDEIIFCGFGFRTDKKAIKIVEKIIQRPIIALKLVNPYFYHLDTCFSILSKDTVMINELAFSSSAIKIIKSKFKHIIKVEQSDNQILACNNVVHQRNIIINKGISQNLKLQLRRLKFNIIETDVSQYLKGGGAVRCLTLIF